MAFKTILNLLKTRMSSKYYNFTHNNINLLIINIFDTKILEFYFFNKNENKYLLVQKNKIKKKVLQIFEKDENIYTLDKFGTLNIFSVKDLYDKFLKNEKNLENENNLEIIETDKLVGVTSLFAKVLNLYFDDGKNNYVFCDDYYRMKIIDGNNFQKILKIFSPRKFFLTKILKLNKKYILFFDDGKIFITDQNLLAIEENFDENKLIDISKHFLKFEQFVQNIFFLKNTDIVVGINLLEQSDKNFDCFFTFLTFCNKTNSFTFLKEHKVVNLAKNFMVVEDDKVVHFSDKSICLNDLLD